MHAIRILRSHGMDDAPLQLVYRAVVIAKITYASSSWWGFTNAADRERLEGFLRRGQRQNLYSAGNPSLAQLLEEADENLFYTVSQKKACDAIYLSIIRILTARL